MCNIGRWELVFFSVLFNDFLREVSYIGFYIMDEEVEGVRVGLKLYG